MRVSVPVASRHAWRESRKNYTLSAGAHAAFGDQHGTYLLRFVRRTRPGTLRSGLLTVTLVFSLVFSLDWTSGLDSTERFTP